MAEFLPDNPLARILDAPEFTAIVPVGARLSSELVDEICANAGAVELRIDQMQPCSDAFIERERLRFGSMPALATIRSKEEGGNWVGSVDEKLDLFRQMLPYVDGIDVELHSAALTGTVELAKERDRIVIASSHHFDGTTALTFSQLEYRYHMAMEAGVDYFKIAAMAHDDDALAPLCGFMELNPGAPIIAVAMGERGVVGRKRLLELGSRATYAFVGDEPVVPGQLSLAEFVMFRESQTVHRAR